MVATASQLAIQLMLCEGKHYTGFKEPLKNGVAITSWPHAVTVNKCCCTVNFCLLVYKYIHHSSKLCCLLLTVAIATYGTNGSCCFTVILALV